MMKHFLLIALILCFIGRTFAQEVIIFTEATETNYYEQGLVDVANLGESSFEHVHSPDAPQFNDKMPASTTAYRGTASLKFSYTSAENGNWRVVIYRNDWLKEDVTKMVSVSCYIYSQTDLPDAFCYIAHQPLSNNNRTIRPTAALSSMPYTPEESMSALKYFYRERGKELFGIYGFYDAFNDNLDRVQEGYIGNDQGPIIVIIENYRSGLLWELVMHDADVQAGLDKLGFQYQVPTDVYSAAMHNDFLLYPKPAGNVIHFILPGSGGGEKVIMKIYSVGGQLKMTKQLFAEGNKYATEISNLQYRHYIAHLIDDGQSHRTIFVVAK